MVEVKELREMHSLTKADLADMLGVSTKTISSWESGTRKPGPSATRLMEVLFFKEKYTLYVNKYNLAPKLKGIRKLLSLYSGGGWQ